jgi:type VI protein secretion system component VasK
MQVLKIIFSLTLALSQPELWAQQQSSNVSPLLCAEDFTANYRSLSARFNIELAGRFPFGSSESPDAEPKIANQFFADYAHQHDRFMSLYECTGDRNIQTSQQLAWLKQLHAASDWFLQPQPLHINMTPELISASIDLLGRSQVVSLSLSSGLKSIRYPGATKTLAWQTGDPLILDFQWAEGSIWLPQSDPHQSDLFVEGATATFQYRSAWSLLRMFNTPEGEALFVVPIKQQNGIKNVAQLKIKISIVDGKQAPVFPRVAP